MNAVTSCLGALTDEAEPVMLKAGSTDADDDTSAEGKLLATVIGVIGSALLQSAVDSVVESSKAPAKRTAK